MERHYKFIFLSIKWLLELTYLSTYATVVTEVTVVTVVIVVTVVMVVTVVTVMKKKNTIFSSSFISSQNCDKTQKDKL